MKKALRTASALIVIMLIAAAVLYKRIEDRRAVAVAHLRAQFDIWDSEVAQLQHDLPVGTSRIEVKKYLDA
jgi:hypothetical protein